MKTTCLIALMLIALKSYSQQNVYTFNNGIILSPEELKDTREAVSKMFPPTYNLIPVIFHKAVKNDTTINYLTLAQSSKSAGKNSSTADFRYAQDSLYLLLDKSLPPFRIFDLDGKEISSVSLLGKPLLINLWATSCVPCIAEMPQLSKVKDRYKDKMNFVSVVIDPPKNINIKEFAENKGFNFQVLQTFDGTELNLNRTSLPKNLFIDSKGVLRYIQPNYPMKTPDTFLDMDSKDNYFTWIINELIKQSPQ